MKRQLPDLPPKVAAHVRAKLLAYDWEQQTSQLRKVCEGCPEIGRASCRERV